MPHSTLRVGGGDRGPIDSDSPPRKRKRDESLDLPKSSIGESGSLAEEDDNDGDDDNDDKEESLIKSSSRKHVRPSHGLFVNGQRLVGLRKKIVPPYPRKKNPFLSICVWKPIREHGTRFQPLAKFVVGAIKPQALLLPLQSQIHSSLPLLMRLNVWDPPRSHLSRLSLQ